MVEGPQTSYLSKRISKRFKNQNLTKVEIKKGRYKSHALKNLKSFQQDLPLKLKDIYKKGKVLFLFFDPWTIIVRFGMTGWFYFDEKEVEGDIVFTFANQRKLIFDDVRHFGTLTITKDADQVLSEMEKIAPDILDQKITFQDIRDRLQNLPKESNIDSVLNDQKLLLSGIGNIMKSEILYDAKISPKRKVKDISDKEWKRIYSSARKITNKVYKEIEKGSANEFLKIQKIYQMESDPKGNPVERFIAKDGRVSFWVPQIQI